MIQTLTKGDQIDRMIDVLSEDGVFVIPDYIQGHLLDNLHDEVLDKCKTEAGHYEFGRNYRGTHLRRYPEDSFIRYVYDSDWMKNLHSKYSGVGTFGRDVFATHDYIPSESLARNGWLHFDRLWRLKFFICLTDVDESCGAFRCSPKSRATGKKLREGAWGGKKGMRIYEDVKNRIEVDYPELLDEYPDVPVEVSAGSLIVFDTDTFHCGGKVEEGKERLVVRLHCG